jgi:hypothetical protein
LTQIIIGTIAVRSGKETKVKNKFLYLNTPIYLSLKHAVPLLTSRLTACVYNLQFAAVMEEVERKAGRNIV